MDFEHRTIRPPAWARFGLGAFTCTVVSDGRMEMGPAAANFPTADPGEIDALLGDYHSPADNVVLDQNLLVLDTGAHLVLFDTGVGVNAELGRRTFGEQTGQAIPNLAAAGIAPEDIDVVAITHAHPDHCWGLVDDDGRRLYPNARVAISQVDFDFWTDLSKVADAPTQHAADHFIGAHTNLMPYADGMIVAADGTQIVPGVTARDASGHSPGHVLYEIESEGEMLVCWGDVCHHQVLLLQHPEWSFQFDWDKPAATAQRRRVYDWVQHNGYEVFAYHFPFPGRGHLREAGSGYDWLPTAVEFFVPPDITPGVPPDSALRASGMAIPAMEAAP